MTSPLGRDDQGSGAVIDGGQAGPPRAVAPGVREARPGTRAGQSSAPDDLRGQGEGRQAWPLAAVAVTVTWSLWELRATVLPAQFLDDSSLHEQMVRFATSRLRAGHDPLTAWFPNLGLGSPQFLHYQSTPAILTGLVGLVVGPDAAFRWSLYLLWCLWPIAIYASARVFGLDRRASALAAAVAPLLQSVPGIGYEQHAYLWAGYGVWTQLWASWTLPFAWALCWRAMADRRFIAPAAGLVALTAAFHYETGYLAFMPVLIMPFLVCRDLRARLARAAALLAAALLASAWVVLPLLLYSRWAGINQALAGTPSANGYGARVTLGWLVTGRLLDAGHLPVVSLLAAAGLAAAVAGWRRAGLERALVVLLCAAILLSFGRSTFGGLIGIVPGSTDIFFRRFLMGGQLAGIYLAGLGAAEIARQGGRLAAACAGYFNRGELARLSWVAATVLAATCLFPAWRYLDHYDELNSTAIHAQQALQSRDGPQIAAMAAFIRRHGDGRAYAGSPENWGQYFTVGLVPMYKYLESLDIDEIGGGLRTASLMTQPEYHFDQDSPGDYALFGIRYLILPASADPSSPPPAPPRGAILVLRESLFRVYELPGNSCIRIVDTVGAITANRADVGSQTARYLQSALPGQARYLTVAYGGARPARPTLPTRTGATGPAGTVLAENAELTDGTATATVRLNRRAVVVLSASFDPGWSVTVDGRPAAVQMIAPALVGVAVPPGTHRIAFRYTGFAGYPELLALAVLGLLAVAVVTRGRRRPCPAAAHERAAKSPWNKADNRPRSEE